MNICYIYSYKFGKKKILKKKIKKLFFLKKKKKKIKHEREIRLQGFY